MRRQFEIVFAVVFGSLFLWDGNFAFDVYTIKRQANEGDTFTVNSSDGPICGPGDAVWKWCNTLNAFIKATRKPTDGTVCRCQCDNRSPTYIVGKKCFDGDKLKDMLPSPRGTCTCID